MSQRMTKPLKWHVCPAKTQISLGIHPDWSGPSLSEWRKLGSLATHWAHSKDSDQMYRLTWVFPGCTCHFVGFVMRWLRCFLVKRNALSGVLKSLKDVTRKYSNTLHDYSDCSCRSECFHPNKSSYIASDKLIIALHHINLLIIFYPTHLIPAFCQTNVFNS